MKTIDILSVNISQAKGTVKKPVSFIQLTATGIEGDAHAGSWHRQVSLLAMESIERSAAQGQPVPAFGAYAENITTRGYPLEKMQPLDRLVSGDVILEVTQIGKECHGERCAIFRETGDCIMPREGIFARVLHPGKLAAGDLLEYHPRILKTGIITVSDRASRGEYEDRSGPALRMLVEEFFAAHDRALAFDMHMVPDEAEKIRQTVLQCRDDGCDMIFTTGGTGIGPRDITPETVRPLLDKEIPGIMELVRVKYGTRFPNALLSRGIAGVMGKCLVYTLPGSTGGVKDYCAEILITVEHSLRMLHGLGH